MVEHENPALPLSQQCRLLAVPRSSVYRKPVEVSAEDLTIMALIDRQYLARPYYGSRRMAPWLATQGHRVNRKRVQRLMRLLGLAAIYQRPNTSKPAVAHKVYPYLLRGLTIERVNQVWCSDVTYIPMAKGFLYLVVIMDWVSRAVLAWRLSNTLGADFCVDALEEALSRYGRPEIFNTDQGSQFTSDDFTGTLKDHRITISMDGKGRCMDNIFVERLWRSLKYEEVYLNAYATVAEARAGTDWLAALLQHGAPAPEPGLSHAAANLPGRPVDMWTIGVADWRRFPRFPSEIGKQGNARLRPHPTGTATINGLILMK
jgi:putative transposase